nr:nucleolar protein [Cryptomonas sp.]
MINIEENLPLFNDTKKVISFLKTTLGPRGMDKLLISKSGEIKVTNDGATILKNITSNSVVKNILCDLTNAHDNEIGDGTTSICCFVGELIEEAEKLIQIQVHPQIIIKGYRLAAREALSILNLEYFDHSLDARLFCEDLLNMARTTLCSKVVYPVREHFARLAVEAVLKLKGSTDINHIKIMKKFGGTLRDSFIEDGLILESKIGTSQPKRIENARILIANTSLDSDKVKIYGTRIKVSALSKLAKIEIADQKRVLDKCKKIISHKINVFVNRQLIYNRQESFLTNHGIISIEHADFEGTEHLALVTGAEIVSTFDEPSKVKIGHCKIVEEIIVGDETMVRFGGCSSANACTLVLRGSNQQLLDEAERSIHDTLCVLSQSIRDPRFVWGGGSLDTRLSLLLEKFSKNFLGKISLAILAFSRAIQNLPKIILENAELDSTDIITQLRMKHEKNEAKACIDIKNESVSNADRLGLIELSRLKSQMIISAVETAEMILRVDKVFFKSS